MACPEYTGGLGKSGTRVLTLPPASCCFSRLMSMPLCSFVSSFYCCLNRCSWAEPSGWAVSLRAHLRPSSPQVLHPLERPIWVLLQKHNGTKKGFEIKVAQVNGSLQRIPKDALLIPCKHCSCSFRVPLEGIYYHPRLPWLHGSFCESAHHVRGMPCGWTRGASPRGQETLCSWHRRKTRLACPRAREKGTCPTSLWSCSTRGGIIAWDNCVGQELQPRDTSQGASTTDEVW